MADQKNNPNQTEEQPQTSQQGGRMTEVDPGKERTPFGAADNHEDVNRTPAKQNADSNPGGTPSTVGGDMNPSVTGPLEGQSTNLVGDSQFNVADPQAAEIAGDNPAKEKPGTEGAGDVRKKAS